MKVWIGITLLILFAWMVKRIHNRRKMERWAEEDSPRVVLPPDETIH